jgi:hypothetical protein
MKPKKSAEELATIIMREVRKRADWSNVLDAVILPHIGASPHQPNWKAAFTIDGPRNVPAEAQQIARELSAKFDWDEKR